MEEKLFKTALEYINKYSIKAYAININPGAMYSRKIKLQGDLIDNQKVFSVLEFEEDKENNWVVYKGKQVDITLIKEDEE